MLLEGVRRQLSGRLKFTGAKWRRLRNGFWGGKAKLSLTLWTTILLQFSSWHCLMDSSLIRGNVSMVTPVYSQTAALIHIRPQRDDPWK